MSMREVIYQAVKHHGVYGAAEPYYDAFSGTAAVKLAEGLAGKTAGSAIFAQVAQAAMRDRGARSRMDRSSPENAGLIFAESVIKMLGSVKGQLEIAEDVSIPQGTALPLLEGGGTVTPAVIKRITEVFESMSGEYYDAEKVDGLVSAYDLDGTDGSHWLMEFVTRGRRPFTGYAVLLTNPRGRVFEVGAGEFSTARRLNLSAATFDTASRQAQPSDQGLYEALGPLDEQYPPHIYGHAVEPWSHQQRTGAPAYQPARMPPSRTAQPARRTRAGKDEHLQKRYEKSAEKMVSNLERMGKRFSAEEREAKMGQFIEHMWTMRNKWRKESTDSVTDKPTRFPVYDGAYALNFDDTYMQESPQAAAEKMVKHVEKRRKEKLSATARTKLKAKFAKHAGRFSGDKDVAAEAQGTVTGPLAQGQARKLEDRISERAPSSPQMRSKWRKLSKAQKAMVLGTAAIGAGVGYKGAKHYMQKVQTPKASMDPRAMIPLGKQKSVHVYTPSQEMRRMRKKSRLGKIKQAGPSTTKSYKSGQAVFAPPGTEVELTRTGMPGRRYEGIDEDFKSDFRQALKTERKLKKQPEGEDDGAPTPHTSSQQIWETVQAKGGKATGTSGSTSAVVAGPRAAQGNAEALWEAVQRNNNVDTQVSRPASSQFNLPAGITSDPRMPELPPAQVGLGGGDGVAETCETPGTKVRSKGKGKSKGPVGRPVSEADFAERMRIKLRKQKGQDSPDVKVTQDDGYNEGNTFPRTTGVDMGRVRRDEIYPRIFQALQSTPYKAKAVDIAHAVEEIVVRERRHMHGIFLSKEQIGVAFTSLFKEPKVQTLMRVTSANIPKMADVLGTVFVKEAHKRFQQGTPSGDFHEIVKSHMDPDYPPDPAPDRVTPQALKLMAVNGWTLSQALQFGRKYLASHGFTQRDILSIQSQHKLGTKEAD